MVDGDEYDYVTRTSFNQGILRSTGYINEENLNEKGTWSLGLLQMDFFYRKKPWYAGQFVRKIVPKINMNHGVILFFTIMLNMQKPKLLSVLVRDVDRTFSNSKIRLPETPDGEIDFEFMDRFISELEEERISELSTYLKVSGLDNYELSDAEKHALEDFENARIPVKQYKIGDLFEIKSTPSFDTDKLVDGDEYDYVTRTSFNQGILRSTGYINEENLNEKGTWSLGLLQMDFFYRKKPWYAGQFVRKIVPKINMNHGAILFFTIMLNMQKPKLLSVLVRDVDRTFSNSKIRLPKTQDGDIDFEYMQTLISAVQKLVIKDVVLYADKKIEATKKVTRKN